MCSLVAAAALLAACGSTQSSQATAANAGGSSSGSSSSTLAAAQAAIAQAMKPPIWNGPTSSPPIAKNRFVVAIPCSEAAAGCARPAAAFLQAAKFLGWKTLLIDPAGDPNKLQAAFYQAHQLGAAGIFAPGASISQVRAVVPQLRKAGMALVTMTGPLSGNMPSPTGWSANIAHYVDYMPKVLAAYVAVHSGGKGNVLVIDDSEYPEIHRMALNFENDLKRYCSGCSVDQYVDFSIVDISTTLPQRVKAVLQSHPEINWIDAPYDFSAYSVVPAIDEIGLRGKVHLVSWDGNPENFQFIRTGNVDTATDARSLEWIGYAAADQMNRIFNHKPTLITPGTTGEGDENYGVQLLDQSNLPSTNAVWNPGVDFRGKYEAIWTAGKG
jgi:ribose transport system substrate-binding protein